jgi:hypothetical protein
MPEHMVAWNEAYFTRCGCCEFVIQPSSNKREEKGTHAAPAYRITQQNVGHSACETDQNAQNTSRLRLSRLSIFGGKISWVSWITGASVCDSISTYLHSFDSTH